MSTQDAKERLELLQGTLDLLILRTLIFGSQHGQGIARAIQERRKKSCSSNTGRLSRAPAVESEAGSLPSGEPHQITEGPAFTR